MPEKQPYLHPDTRDTFDQKILLGFERSTLWWPNVLDTMGAVVQVGLVEPNGVSLRYAFDREPTVVPAEGFSPLQAQIGTALWTCRPTNSGPTTYTSYSWQVPDGEREWLASKPAYGCGLWVEPRHFPGAQESQRVIMMAIGLPHDQAKGLLIWLAGQTLFRMRDPVAALIETSGYEHGDVILAHWDQAGSLSS